MPWWSSGPYHNWQPLVLPHRSKRLHITISTFELCCTHCGSPVHALRGVIEERRNHVEVKAGGICIGCKMIVYSQFRWYTDNTMLIEERNGWQKYKLRARYPAWAAIQTGWKWLRDLLALPASKGDEP